jgi:beta-lactamase superfamily II metal-dependent hydrolase
MSGDGVSLDVLAPSLPFLVETADDVNENSIVVMLHYHGSRYASTSGFAADVHPRIAVISVGRHNTFGHPAMTTVEMWHQTGADILRTDQCGAVLLTVASPPITMLRCASP